MKKKRKMCSMCGKIWASIGYSTCATCGKKAAAAAKKKKRLIDTITCTVETRNGPKSYTAEIAHEPRGTKRGRAYAVKRRRRNSQRSK